MMPKLYADANPTRVAWVLDGGGGGSGFVDLPEDRYTSVEAEYLAIIMALNWLVMTYGGDDARQADYDPELKEYVNVNVQPSTRTPTPLPSPLEILSDNEPVVMQLSRQWHIREARLLKYAQTVWNQTQNLSVTFSWIPRKENLAGYMLK